MSKKINGFELWTKMLNRAKYIVAPMVDQSELPWRLLGRQYGAELCYTPMFHAALFKRDHKYRKDNFVVCERDRPLIVQFCANDPKTLLEAAKFVAPYCDAVDINLGCPQSIAKKGHYGAFLQDEWDLLHLMISLLDRELSVPVTCKIRVFDDIERTVKYAQMLEKAGCQLLTVHGRTREQKGGQTGLASWDHIKAVKQNVSIPVFANGNIQYLKDVEKCLIETGVEGVMSAEGHLFNPAIFTGEHPPCWRISKEYLDLVRQYPCAVSAIRGHIFKIWLHVLKEPEFQCFRGRIGVARTVDEFEKITTELKDLLLEKLSGEDLNAEFELDKIPFWRCQPYFRPNRGVAAPPEVAKDTESLTAKKEERVRRKRRMAENKAAQCLPRKKRYFACENCQGNPKGSKCVHQMCKICCRSKCLSELVGCLGHRITPRSATQPTMESREQTTQSHKDITTRNEIRTKSCDPIIDDEPGTAMSQ